MDNRYKIPKRFLKKVRAMQSVNADIEEVLDETIKTVEASDESDDFDCDFYKDYEDYKAAEARFVAQLQEDLESLKNGTLKTYTREEYEPIRREFWRKLKGKHAVRAR